MKKFILGKKIGMTQIFTEEGLSIPVTAVQAGPVSVLQVKTDEQDGYCAVKVGYEDIKESKTNKPMKGSFDKSGVTPKRYLKEIRLEDSEGFEVGKDINVGEMFSEGDVVDVTGVSKGKGFAGTVKRYKTSRGPETHGSHYHRAPGSMGSATDPGRVFKGKRLPGHMGSEKVTVQNLVIVKVYEDKNLLLVKGAVPGPKGGVLVIKEAVKA
ncbi:MAG: 50S ribosomal protein L3 [Clostridia bacterium]|nr:50S ribosomal protein L3 [Clostridia bacterium]MBN2884030.1 50S ribosomal protein L3 [Clostridia bacterium]